MCTSHDIPLLICCLGTLRQKRQLAQVSPDDVLLIGSPVTSNDELVIAFLVVGQDGEPLNGSILATALEDGGNQLASALSTAVGCANSITFVARMQASWCGMLYTLHRETKT